METPKTYNGYDKDNNCIVTVTAYDANNIVNPDEVKAAIEGVKQAASEAATSIVSALNQITPDADEAVIVEGTKMTGVIEELCTTIGQLPDKVMGNIEGLYDESVQIHDKYQIEANQKAEADARSTANVVNVTSS